MTEKKYKIPEVTVELLTYNQARYVRTCLDSIFKQKTTFDFDVVIGDDCSTDGTQEIIKEYKKKYPDQITAILRKENIGGTANLYDVLGYCKGRYIAPLEGDDYWTDENKIQFQYDFLEKHPEFVGCSQNVEVVDENDIPLYLSGKNSENFHWSYDKSRFTIDEYLKSFKLPGQGSTHMYRNIWHYQGVDYSLIREASPYVGDLSTLVLLLSQGDWYYMKDVTMARYRVAMKAGGSSFTSWIKTHNIADYQWIMIDKIEKYVRKTFKKKGNFSKYKYNNFKIALDIYFDSKRGNDRETIKRNKQIVYRIIKADGLGALIDLARYVLFYILDKNCSELIRSAIRNDVLDMKNHNLNKSTWKLFNKMAVGRTIVAFGSGDGLLDFLNKYGEKYDVPICIDNRQDNWGKGIEHYFRNQNFWSEKWEIIEIRSPNEICNWVQNKFVILITSTFYCADIAKQLNEMGFYDYFSYGHMEAKKVGAVIYKLLWSKFNSFS